MVATEGAVKPQATRSVVAVIADEMADATSPAEPVALTPPEIALVGRVGGTFGGSTLVSRGPVFGVPM